MYDTTRISAHLLYHSIASCSPNGDLEIELKPSPQVRFGVNDVKETQPENEERQGGSTTAFHRQTAQILET